MLLNGIINKETVSLSRNILKRILHSQRFGEEEDKF
jgi:hypothetical protein